MGGLDKSGWKINGEEIMFDWVKGNLIVPEQLLDILCEQNVEGVQIGMMVMVIMIGVE